jgi:hypothetical protein
VLLELKKTYGGEIEIGELTIEEESGGKEKANEKSPARLLPAGIFARWSSN